MVGTGVRRAWDVVTWRVGGALRGWIGTVEIVVVILVGNIADPYNVPFTGENYVSLLIGRVNNIEHLLCLLGQYERIVMVPQPVEINGDNERIARWLELRKLIFYF